MAEEVGAAVVSCGEVMLNPYAHPQYHIVGHIIGDTGKPSRGEQGGETLRQ